MARLFLFGAPATCAKDFVYGGKPFAKGAPFPYDQQYKLTELETRGLWLADYIEFPDPTKLVAKPAVQQQGNARR